MKYQRFDASECGFPKPRVPILPSLNWYSLCLFENPNRTFTRINADTNSIDFSRGRYALTEAYRQCGVGKHGALLAPSYHCRTMLDPAIRLGAQVILYHVKIDLSPDLDSLAAILATSKQPIKALLVTHYFGFAQDLASLKEFCARNQIVMIEDCTHAMFVKSDGNTRPNHQTIGKTGRYCVASPYKFFPSEDGGVLWTNSRDTPAMDPQERQPLKQEIKAVVHAMQSALSSATTANTTKQFASTDHMDGHVAPHRDDRIPDPIGLDTVEQTSGTSPYYHAEQEHLQSLVSSRWVMRHTNLKRLVDRRRQYYQHWVSAVADLPHCRALFSELPDDCVPYMFPLYIDHPESHFYALKQLGIPIWRWDDVAKSNCSVATDYRLKVLHLPCHQELLTYQIDWMTTAVKKIMKQKITGSSS